MGYLLLRRLLFALPPEQAHALTLQAARWLVRLGLWKRPMEICEPVSFAGLSFPNPVGIAAGMDKNADYLDVWWALGAGFVEVGTVTPRPQAGNPRPRLFRLPQDQALINRMGFNNKGADYVVERLKRFQHRDQMRIGVSLGKNKTTPDAQAHQDYKIVARKVAPYCDFLVINVSSPNTPGLRQLQYSYYLEGILQSVRSVSGSKPLWVKLSPDEVQQVLVELRPLWEKGLFDALVLTNTTVQRPGLKTSTAKLQAIGHGGLSGKPLFPLALRAIEQARRLLPDVPLVGVGGIVNCAQAQAMRTAGAQLVEVFTGLDYRGPGLISELKECLCNLKANFVR